MLIRQFTRRHDPKIVGHGQRVEGGDVEPLLRRLAHVGALIVGLEQIAVPLAESVVHFVEDGLQTSVRSFAEIDAQGIEHRPQHTRHAEEPHPTAGPKAAVDEDAVHLRLQGRH